MKKTRPIPVLAWLKTLRWLDGTPLVVEPYRARIFEQAFSVDEAGRLRYSLVLTGRGKKTFKSADLALAALYSLLLRSSMQGSDCFILANDEQQAGDDLELAAKLVKANTALSAELVIRAKSIERRDGRGSLMILPARDIAGSHGKTAGFLGWDELHAHKDYSLWEALSPDPTRSVVAWVASYDSLFHTIGRPLYDMFLRGRAGTDPEMLFDWHSGTYCTCPDGCEGKTPEERANPSMASWSNPRYLAEQKRRLPSVRYRRLHLNEGGQPEGAALSGERLEAAVVPGRKSLPFVEGIRYFGFVDMSGGSNDDACVAVAHRSEDGKLVLDYVANQGPRPPFDPRQAVRRFAAALGAYHVSRVKLDNYAGMTFRADFEAAGFACEVYTKAASDLYEALEPHLNAGEVELLDQQTLVEQFVGLVWKGGKITHASDSLSHDDWCNAAAGALLEAVPLRSSVILAAPDYQSGDTLDQKEDAAGDGGNEPGTAIADPGGQISEYAARERRYRHGLPGEERRSTIDPADDHGGERLWSSGKQYPDPEEKTPTLSRSGRVIPSRW